ncbi:head-tail adaptor protein [Yoonia sp.]|uniref:head-tail adaptor protein n=1 Tax=Yoonia sp. TaxID=2212373 RepID=UPI002FDAE764
MAEPVMNRALVLEAPLKVADGAGGYERTWEPLGVLWAEIRAATGREVLAGQATRSRVPLKITVRAAPHDAPSRPKAGQRFLSGAQVFNILAVTEAGTHAQYLLCHADEEVAP